MTETTPAKIERLLRAHTGTLSVEFVLSPAHDLPPAMKALERSVRLWLTRLGVPVRVVRPARLAGEKVVDYTALGVRPFEVKLIQKDKQVTRNIWSALAAKPW